MRAGRLRLLVLGPRVAARARLAVLDRLRTVRQRDRRRLGERKLLPLLELGDLLVGRARVVVDGEEAGLDEHAAAHEVGLGAGLDVGARRLRNRRVAECGDEAAHDQLVDLLVLRVGQDRWVKGLRRVDRRVVGRLLLAARRLELVPARDRRGLLERGNAADRLQQLAHRKRVGIDGVVGARIGDEPVHVEVLRDPHRARGRDADARGRARERGRVERRRRLARRAPRRDRLHRAGAARVRRAPPWPRPRPRSGRPCGVR